MAASHITGPLIVSGGNQALLPGMIGGAGDPDPNPAAGPSLFEFGIGLLDLRMFLAKDRTASAATAAALMGVGPIKTAGVIPSALSATNVAAAANAVSGTAMTLAAASLGISRNVPIIPFSGVFGAGAPITAAIVFDMPFAFANCTSGAATVVVPDSSVYLPGMPLVIGGVGNSGGTIPLLCRVASITDATHIVLTSEAIPLATNTTSPVGTGNQWSGNGPKPGYTLPIAWSPLLASGVGALLDPRQSLTRGIQITGVTGGAGGTFTVVGFDNYFQTVTETITVGAGAVTGYSKKAFKGLMSVTPNFADAHNYSVGTSDVFGFGLRTPVWEESIVFWAGAQMAAATGFTAPLALSGTVSGTSADVRGTVQTGAAGGGSGIGSNASNGALTSNVMGGRRLDISTVLSVASMAAASYANAAPIYGLTQA